MLRTSPISWAIISVAIHKAKISLAKPVFLSPSNAFFDEIFLSKARSGSHWPRRYESSSFKQFSICSKDGVVEYAADDAGWRRGRPDVKAERRGAMSAISERRLAKIGVMWIDERIEGGQAARAKDKRSLFDTYKNVGQQGVCEGSNQIPVYLLGRDPISSKSY